VGFPALKIALASDLTETKQGVVGFLEHGDSLKEIIEKATRIAEQNLHDSATMIDPAALSRAVQALRAAQIVTVYVATGIDQGIAGSLLHRLLQCGIPSRILADAEQRALHASQGVPGVQRLNDVVIALARHSDHVWLLDVLPQVRNRETFVILLTDMLHSDLSQSADATFVAATRSSGAVVGDVATYTAVNTSADNTTPDSLCTQREAISANSNAPTTSDCGTTTTTGNIIEFDTGVFTTGSAMITFASASTLTITQDLTIDASAVSNPNGVTVNANSLPTRVFEISNSATVTITNLTITGGNVSGSFPSNTGGGIRVDDSSLTLNNSRVNGNSSSNVGGGIYSIDGSVTIENGSTVSANSAGLGGGIYTTGIDATVLIDASTIGGTNTISPSVITEGNTGNGIYNGDGIVTIQNGSRVSGNTMPGASPGAGIHNQNTTTVVIIDNSVIGGTNTATTIEGNRVLGNQGGGGIYNVGPHSALLPQGVGGF
jgi:DNA-binding MurR/RpiR family transcriptional regulator